MFNQPRSLLHLVEKIIIIYYLVSYKKARVKCLLWRGACVWRTGAGCLLVLVSNRNLLLTHATSIFWSHYKFKIKIFLYTPFIFFSLNLICFVSQQFYHFIFFHRYKGLMYHTYLHVGHLLWGFWKYDSYCLKFQLRPRVMLHPSVSPNFDTITF